MIVTQIHYTIAILLGYLIGCVAGVIAVGGSPPNFLLVLLLTPKGLLASFDPFIGGRIAVITFLVATVVLLTSVAIFNNTRYKVALPIGMFLFTLLLSFLGSSTISTLATI